MYPLCIYPKEAARILNFSLRKAQRIFKTIGEALSKEKQHLITIKEFSEYMGLEESDVLNALEKMKTIKYY